MKHISFDKIVGGFGIFAACASFYVLATVSEVLAEHNEKEKAHPALIQVVRDNTAAIDKLAQKVDLGQKADKESHDRQEKAVSELTTLMTTLIAKIP